MNNDEAFCRGCNNKDNSLINEDGFCERCQQAMSSKGAYDRYYQPSVKTIMVPVKVSYHDPTDTFIAFTPLTLEQVEEAYKANKHEQVEDALKRLLDFVTSGRRYETVNPYFIKEVKDAFTALGLNHLGKKE